MVILEKNTQQFISELEAKGGTPIYKMSVPDARKVLEDLQKDGEMAVDIEDKMAGSVSIRIIRPKNNKDKLPVIMYYHGGGWILGSKNTHHRLISELAIGVNAALVFINYTPSPEAKFPQSINEAFAATQYIAEKGAEFNLDVSRMVIVGDSVGGNMTAAVSLMAKEKGIKLLYQALFYPVTDANFNTGSFNEFANGPWLTKAGMEWFWNAYEPDVSKRKNPLASPLQASLEQLKGLPPALIIVDENDVLRDEGEAYARKLMQAGVEVTAVRVLGTCHDFMMLKPLAQTPATRSAIALAIQHLKKALNK